MTWLKGEHYQHGCHCCDCGIELTDEIVRERIISPGEPEMPWESGGRMPGEERPLIEQIEGATIIELTCNKCYEN